MVTSTDSQILTARIIKGNDYCNSLWQQAKMLADSPTAYSEVMDKLTHYTEKLRELVAIVNLQGYTGCCFGSCKWDDDNFICFGCTKEG